MENLMEMEYVINGEKYIITATKVEDLKEADNTEVVEAEFPAMEETDFVEVEAGNLVQVSLSLMPEGFELIDWLDIIKNYGVILTD
jgi:hypothetical protein